MRSLILFVLVLAAASLHADLPLTAHWDFTKGSINSVDGKYQMSFRGASEIVTVNGEKALLPGMTTGPKPSGIMCSGSFKGLSPVGAFRIETEVSFNEPTSNRPQMFLYDTKNVPYVSKAPLDNIGVLFYVARDFKRKDFVLGLSCGAGSESFNVRGKWIPCQFGKKYLLAVEYDPAGTVTFSVDGNKTTVKTAFGGALVAGVRRPVIGDRCGSLYAPFDGHIFWLKLFSEPAKEEPAAKTPAKPAAKVQKPVIRPPSDLFVTAGFSRAAFFRNEKNAVVKAELCNPFAQPVTVSDIRCTVAGQPQQTGYSDQTIEPRGKIILPVKVDTEFKVGQYDCQVEFTAERAGKSEKKSLRFPVFIGPQDLPRFSIFTEAVYDQARKNIVWLGMNKYYPAPVSMFLDNPYKAALGRVPGGLRSLDWALANGLRQGGLFRLMPHWSKKYPRHDRDGRTFLATEVSNPKLIAEAKKAAALSAKFMNHPAVEDVNLNEEMRDVTAPSFNRIEPEAFRKIAGYDIPQKVNAKTSPVNYKLADKFPASRVIPEKEPYYVYYQWFWCGGDGWPVLDGKIAAQFKKHFTTPIKARYAPANRMPPIWYLADNIDIVDNWAYLDPDPIAANAMISELAAFAAQRKKPLDILGHITLIMYRSGAAPKGYKVAKEPAWVKKFPNAKYITVAPDMLTEGLWVQLSRQICGMDFHGYNAIYDSNIGWNYICSNHDTKNALRDVLVNVAQPLGPLVSRLPERPVEVAALHSFASFVYAGRGSWGGRSWMFESNLAMLRGNLMPGVIFEDQILRDGFGKIKVLVLTYCDVLPQKVAEKIREFQAKGGIVVGDQFTAPAIMPDLMITPVERSGDPVADKAALQKAGLDLRRMIASKYTPYTNSSNPDLITWVRSDKDADYLFVINDKRTFGDYIGQYGLIQENGMPNSGTVTIKRKAGAVYDLVRNIEVPFTSEGNQTTIPVKFETCDGRALLILPEKVGKIGFEVPQELEKGKGFTLTAKLSGVSGKPIPSLHPMKITVKSADGTETDETGYAVFADGKFTRRITIPKNAAAGTWSITIREAAAGINATRQFTVK